MVYELGRRDPQLFRSVWAPLLFAKPFTAPVQILTFCGYQFIAERKYPPLREIWAEIEGGVFSFGGFLTDFHMTLKIAVSLLEIDLNGFGNVKIFASGAQSWSDLQEIEGGIFVQGGFSFGNKLMTDSSVNIQRSLSFNIDINSVRLIDSP